MLSVSRRFSGLYSTFKSLPLGRRRFSLHLVTNRLYAKDNAHFIDKVMQAVDGGVTCVQYSDPHADFCTKFRLALSLKEQLHARGIPLIINNHVEIALAVGADGVHLGQNDLSLCEARGLLGSRAIIGLTVDTWEDVLKAEELDVDYLGVQVFPSKFTKPDSKAIWGLEGLRRIRTISRHRVVAIGGINLDNLSHVYTELNAGDGVAMVGALWGTHDPELAAKRVTALFHRCAFDKKVMYASI